MFSLARWQAALSGPHADAQGMRGAGLFREAFLIDQTLLRVIAPLVADLEGDGGWQRALGALANPTAPLLLDATAGEDFGVPSVRLTAILALPPLESVASPDDISGPIRAAIARGAPTYNEGDARGCGVIYWVTAFTIVSAPVMRGFTGQARALRALRGAVEETIPPIGNQPAALDDFAWRMRRALDVTLDLLR